jgi:hypothetical protein
MFVYFFRLLNLYVFYMYHRNVHGGTAAADFFKSHRVAGQNLINTMPAMALQWIDTQPPCTSLMYQNLSFL